MRRYEERDCSAKIELKPNKPPAAITSFFKKVAPEAGAAGAATAAIAAATVTIDTKSPMATAEIPAKRSSSSAPKRDFNKKEKEKELKVMSLWQNDGGTDATPAVEGSTGTSARIDGGGGGDEKMAILDHGKEQQERGKDSQERCVAQAQPLSLPSPPQEAGEDGTGSGDGGGGNSGGSPLPLDLTPEEMEFVYGKGHGLIAAQSSPSGKAAVTAEGSGGDDSPKSPTSGMKKRPAAPAAKASSRSNNSSSKRQGSPSVSRSKTRKKNNDDNNQPTLASFFQRSS